MSNIVEGHNTEVRSFCFSDDLFVKAHDTLVFDEKTDTNSIKYLLTLNRKEQLVVKIHLDRLLNSNYNPFSVKYNIENHNTIRIDLHNFINSDGAFTDIITNKTEFCSLNNIRYFIQLVITAIENTKAAKLDVFLYSKLMDEEDTQDE